MHAFLGVVLRDPLVIIYTLQTSRYMMQYSEAVAEMPKCSSESRDAMIVMHRL
jgi:hypothetical protein